ncbi:MAG: porin, partial [Opitutaceae bacterium]|nr:porin [Opitutaceae bacterium]
LGGAVRFNGGGAGTLQLSASAFFADTSFLNQSKITDRGDLRKSDGGLSNTEDLSSYAVALDGNDIPDLDGLHYHLGFSHQASGVGGGSDENAFAIGVEYAVGVSPDLEVTPMIEYARLNDAGGVSGDDTGYLTAGVGATYGAWNMAISYAGRDNDSATSDDSVFQVSAGYAFEFGLGVDVGWRKGDEGGQDSETAGILLTYGYEF